MLSSLKNHLILQILQTSSTDRLALLMCLYLIYIVDTDSNMIGIISPSVNLRDTFSLFSLFLFLF
jgi:hypothetical protein